MELYEARAEVYQAEMEAYQKDVLSYETARGTAVQQAEGVIGSVREEFGWAYVNKGDPAGFRTWLVKTWGAQGALVGIYVIIILFLIKRKDG
jgi:hypothetical protein